MLLEVDMDVKKKLTGDGLPDSDSIFKHELGTISAPEAMNQSFKDAAMCKAAESLIKSLALMNEHQLERVQIFPQKLLRMIPDIPLDKIELISRRLARSLILDRSGSRLNAVDCELNIQFLQDYTVNLFAFESMAKAKAAAQWYLENQFVLTFDISLAKNVYLIEGIKDAVEQGRTTHMQLLAIRAGFTASELSHFFPLHHRSLFRTLMKYCHDDRSGGNALKVHDESLIKEYQRLCHHYLKTTDDVLKAKLLAYNDVNEIDCEFSGEPYPITSYEQHWPQQ